MYLSAMASSKIPAHTALGWQVIVRYFATLAARPYFLKSPTRTFITCCSHSEWCELGNAIVCIEEYHAPPNGIYQYILSHPMVFYRHDHPGSYKLVYHHVE